MTSRAHRAGLTLLELMVSVAITSIILAGVAAAFTAIQGVYQREATLKAAVENARISTSYVERVTRLAGYGIDPRFAIDIDASNLAGGVKTNFTGAITNGTFITDDFAFRYRDPAYLRRGTFDGSNVTIDGVPNTFGIAMQSGRLLQLVCVGAQVWTVVKIGAAVVASDTSVAAGSANSLTNPTSFPVPPTPAAAPCLTQTGANAPFVMLIREVRLRVIPLANAEGGTRPYLVAYNSLDLPNIGSGQTDFDPLAADVESFHVSYAINRGTGTPVDVAGGDWILGNDPGDAVVVPTAVGARPTYDHAYSDPLRFTADVANVRSVTFEISTRSLRQERRIAFLRPVLADDPALPPTVSDGYYHTTAGTSVRTPNMTARTAFTPALKVLGDPNPLNEWGG